MAAEASAAATQTRHFSRKEPFPGALETRVHDAKKKKNAPLSEREVRVNGLWMVSFWGPSSSLHVFAEISFLSLDLEFEN